MPAGRKPTYTREQFVQAAIEMADAHGLASVSTRAVATSIGAGSTAIYRFFTNRDDLISAMRYSILAELPITGHESDPRTSLIQAALAYRALAGAHPCLGEVNAVAALETEGLNTIPHYLIAKLTELGLEGALLIRAYRQLETFVIGATMYDYSGAPEHLEQRLTRMHAIGNATFTNGLADTKALADVNERAFERSFTCLLDSIIGEARTS